MTSAPEISGVVPFYNEAAVATGVIDELVACLNQLGRSFEIVLVDDGSCPSGQILQVIGGHSVQRISRQRVCVPRR